MSLQAHALAITATGALAEALPAWVRVEMEPHDPLTLADDDGERVIVAVFVGDEVAEIKGRSWQQGMTTVELVVQVLLPARVKATIAGVSCTFDTRTGGTRPVYALVHEALRRAFTAPEPGSWRELLQAVWVGHPEALHGMPGKAERPNKPPVPVMDYSIPCRVIMPPALGQPAPTPWPEIVAKMRADAAFTAEEADYFEALIGGDPLTVEQAALALAGLSRAEGAALGFEVADPIVGAP